MATFEVTSTNFNDEVLESDKPVFLDFWATWCGPCRMVSPIVEELSEEHPEMKFGKINTDEQMMLANQFQVTSIPTLVIMNDGHVVAKTIGAMPKEALEEFISQWA